MKKNKSEKKEGKKEERHTADWTAMAIRSWWRMETKFQSIISIESLIELGWRMRVLFPKMIGKDVFPLIMK